LRIRKSLIFFILTAGLVFTLPARAQQKPLTQEQVQASKVGGLLSPAELQLYQHAQTVMEWTPHQIHDCPFIHKLRPASSQKQLPMILERAGQTGTLLLNDFPKIYCLEAVHTEAEIPQVLTDDQFIGNVAQINQLNAMRQPLNEFPPQERTFRYIVIPQIKGGLPGFKEYRTDLNGSPVGKRNLNRISMITSDFASTGLYMSAAHQSESDFRHFGMEVIRKRECHVVGFAQVPERVHTVGLTTVHGKDAALLVQGLAWIDAETFQILRVTTWLLAPRVDIGLKSAISTVDFFPVQPSGTERTLWLPADATVVGTFQGVTFHNKHHYSDFKLFGVGSTIKPGP